MQIKGWLGGCCGVAEVKGLTYDGNYFIKNIIDHVENERVDGGVPSKKVEHLHAYVFADRKDGNGDKLTDYIRKHKLGKVTRTKGLKNSYSVHGGLKAPDSTIRVYIFQPDWDKMFEWDKINYPKKTKEERVFETF